MVLFYNLGIMEIVCLKSKYMRGIMEQNTFVLTKGKFAIIIDAGADLEDVKAVVGNKKVLGVFMTHLHFDHFWYLDEYLDEFDTSVYIQKGFENKFEEAELNGSYLIRKAVIKNISKKRIKYYAKNINLENFEIEVFDTPGHCTDCVCILVERKLFTGDTIFSDCIGRIDLKDSSKEQMIESLEKIKIIDFDEAFPGHYEAATKQQIIKTISFYL
jgi:glyoxylase-like metal-dependent hydrolase (beta-lactamase superfamily II)